MDPPSAVPPAAERPTPAVALALAAGLLAISSAAIFIRISDASALVTAFYRLAMSTCGMWCVLAVRARGSVHDMRLGIPWRATIPAGIALAAHFWLWMRSLELTSVLVSTLFVTTTPLWLALAAPLLPGEPKLRLRGWLGLLIALAGASLLAAVDAESAATGDRPIAGAMFAIAGAWAIAAFLAISRRVRRTTPLLPYAAGATSVAAATLALPIMITSAPLLGFPAGTWAAFVALALLPQIVGHNSLVWAVKFVGATTVGLVTLLEPVGAATLAFLIFDERPTLLHGLAAVILLVGLAQVLRSQTTNASPA